MNDYLHQPGDHHGRSDRHPDHLYLHFAAADRRCRLAAGAERRRLRRRLRA